MTRSNGVYRTARNTASAGRTTAPPRRATDQRAPERRRRLTKFKLFSLGAGIDMPLFFLIIVLMSTGLVMLFSASYAYAYYNFNDSYYFIRQQAMYSILGIVMMLLISTFDYHRFHKLAPVIFLLTVAMLFLVLLLKPFNTPLVKTVNGAARWLNLGFVEFQPSEVAKFSMILIFAHMMSRDASQMHTLRKGFLPYMAILLLFVGLILPEPHISATVIIVAIAFILMVIGGTRIRYMLALAAIGIAILVLLVLFSEGISEKFSYAPARIQGWLDPFNAPPEADTWQTRQSLYAIGSGQLLGVGLGQSRQKYLYLPEPQNDFIFAIVCEELGLIGALIIIILFGLLIWRGVYVSLNARDRFGAILGLGIIFQIGLQIVLNICVVTNTIPNTGISLPFFSYGGTSLMILLSELGVLLQISRSANIEKT